MAKQYIQVDEKGNIIQGYSSSFTIPENIETILIGENENRHFTLLETENPMLSDGEVFLYKYKNKKVQKKSASEIQKEKDALYFDRLKESKLEEIENARAKVYKQGVTVPTSLGEKTFSLTGQDQTNISGLQSKVLIGDPSVTNGVPYHANGEFCIWWTHEDFTLIATKASEFVFYHTTYSNFLNRYIEQIDTIEELEAVYYGMGFPKEIAEQFALFMKGGAV